MDISKRDCMENFEAFLIDIVTDYRYNDNGGMIMLNEMLEQRQMSKYQLAKQAGVPYMTVNDLCNGKTSIGKCNAETVYLIAKAIDVSMEELLESSWEQRASFELFKSNVCHHVKDMGDIDFLIQTLTNDEISQYYQKKWYPECFYLLAMVDYISRLNDIPPCSDYDDLRAMKLSQVIYPSGVIAMSLAQQSEAPKEKAWAESIPEFRRFNIVENEVRNVI